jgi:RimJ/RimL family protein N-acetyltransferase
MDNQNIWQGTKIRLRGIEADDWQYFHAANEDSELARLGYSIPMPRSAEGEKSWTVEQSLAIPKNDEYRWVVETLEGEFAGTLNTHNCDNRNGTFSYGIVIVRPLWGKGYASEAIRLVLRYYFDELRYQKVTVNVYAFNQGSLALHRKLGFTEEGYLRRMVYTQGKYFDEIIFGMTNDEFARMKWNPSSTRAAPAE